jgi:hypothetical protein
MLLVLHAVTFLQMLWILANLAMFEKWKNEIYIRLALRDKSYIPIPNAGENRYYILQWFENVGGTSLKSP